MRTLKFLAIALSASALVWSCESGPSETEKAYTEMTSHTDSIQMMNSHLKDTLMMVMNMSQEMMSTTDSAMMDSSMMASVAATQIKLNEKKASLEKIDAMLMEFESFEATYDKGEMGEEEMKAQMDEIRKQQENIMDDQGEIKADLESIHNTLMNAAEKTEMKGSNEMDAQS